MSSEPPTSKEAEQTWQMYHCLKVAALIVAGRIAGCWDDRIAIPFTISTSIYDSDAPSFSQELADSYDYIVHTNTGEAHAAYVSDSRPPDTLRVVVWRLALFLFVFFLFYMRIWRYQRTAFSVSRGCKGTV